MKSLLNRKVCKEFALECAKARAHKFTRVSKKFLESLEGVIKTTIRFKVESHPSVGKTMTCFLLCFSLYSCQPAIAITDAEGIQCIMGEARNQSYLCQVATGEALRNRGTTQGVFGCKVAVNEPQRVWDVARKAWDESKTSHLVNGASFWESSDFKKPYWAKDMIQTARFGKHIFYKNNLRKINN